MKFRNGKPERFALAFRSGLSLHLHGDKVEREHDGDRAPRLSQREAMAKCRDGVALDRRRHDGGSQRLPSIESLQAPAYS